MVKRKWRNPIDSAYPYEDPQGTRLKRSLPKYHDPGFPHFVTSVVEGRAPIFRDGGNAQVVLEMLGFYRVRYGFRLLGYVVMPEHLHAVILPSSHATISVIMREVKKRSSQRFLSDWKRDQREGFLSQFRSERRDGEISYRVWQEGFYDFNIKGRDTLREKLVYMHNNPVVKGLVVRPEDYSYSSAGCYAKDEPGLLPVDKMM